MPARVVLNSKVIRVISFKGNIYDPPQRIAQREYLDAGHSGPEEPSERPTIASDEDVGPALDSRRQYRYVCSVAQLGSLGGRMRRSAQK